MHYRLLSEIAAGYAAVFPNGDTPFAILARITEEAGEIAAEVNHLEGMGAKHAKHGEADPARLAAEIEDLLHNTVALARYYGIERAVEESIEVTHARLTTRRVREKAVAYVVHEGRLLVFSHPGEPLAGIQVPAGGIDPGEDPADAALRETKEETGVTARIVASLGVFHYDMAPYRDEIQRCHAFHLEPVGDVRERWRGGESDDLPFDCFWIPLADGHVLAGGQATLLSRLDQARTA